VRDRSARNVVDQHLRAGAFPQEHPFVTGQQNVSMDQRIASKRLAGSTEIA
jgi:hypothetical protein